MASMKIKKGDMVKVIAGRDKDKEGKVIAVNKKDNTLLVEGVNIFTISPKRFCFFMAHCSSLHLVLSSILRLLIPSVLKQLLA